MKEILCGIYRITSPSGKIYIGYAKNIHNRWKDYRSLDCKNQIKLYHSFKKHGVENHIFEIIELCDYEKLKEREIYNIALYNTHYGIHGLNLTDGGGGASGYKCSEATKEILRKKNTGRIKSKEEIEKTRISNTGQRRTDEAKEKMRQSKLKIRNEISKKVSERWANMTPEQKQQIFQKIAQKNIGRKQSQESINKRLEKCRGQKRTEEQKRNISLSHVGKKLSEYHKSRLRNGWIKRKKNFPPLRHTEESKRKISEAHKGKPIGKGRKFTVEHKEAISRARKGKPAHNKGKIMNEDQQFKIWMSNKKRQAIKAVEKFNEINNILPYENCAIVQ